MKKLKKCKLVLLPFFMVSFFLNASEVSEERDCYSANILLPVLEEKLPAEISGFQIAEIGTNPNREGFHWVESAGGVQYIVKETSCQKLAQINQLLRFKGNLPLALKGVFVFPSYVSEAKNNEGPCVLLTKRPLRDDLTLKEYYSFLGFALGHLHAHGFFHRDIRHDDIFMRKRSPRLIDVFFTNLEEVYYAPQVKQSPALLVEDFDFLFEEEEGLGDKFKYFLRGYYLGNPDMKASVTLELKASITSGPSK